MDKSQIFVFVAVILAVGIRLYMRYMKKEKEKYGSGTKQSKASFPASSKDDDYEPYSKK